MLDKIMELQKNDKTQNQLALYYLFEYGRQTLKDDNKVSEIKSEIEKHNKGKTPLLSNEYTFGAIDIAKEMANLSVADLSKFIYNNEKNRIKNERSR